VEQSTSWMVQRDTDFVFRQGFKVYYLDTVFHLQLYFIQHDNVTATDIVETYAPKVIDGKPRVGLGDSFNYLTKNHMEFLIADRVTKVKLLMTNWASFASYDAVFIYSPLEENRLFSAVYLEFINLWKDPKDPIINKLTNENVLLEIARKNLNARNFQMVLNSITRMKLLPPRND
jgi:hypothetical protein